MATRGWFIRGLPYKREGRATHGSKLVCLSTDRAFGGTIETGECGDGIRPACIAHARLHELLLPCVVPFGAARGLETLFGFGEIRESRGCGEASIDRSRQRAKAFGTGRSYVDVGGCGVPIAGSAKTAAAIWYVLEITNEPESTVNTA